MLKFSDITIIPQYSEVSSRSLVDLSTTLSDRIKLGLPVISANMANVSGPQMAKVIREHGGLTILPRYKNDAGFDIEQYIKAASMTDMVGASIGVKNTDITLFNRLYDAGCRIFCIDIAHGDSARMKDMLGWIRGKRYSDITIIAGNVATGIGVCHLAEWGADIIKVGIAAGKVCRTRDNTGVYVPQFHAIREADKAREEYNLNVALISDGNIEKVSDISKALIYTDAVMCGYLFSGTTETPGDVFEDETGYYKMYGGSTSAENKLKNEGHSNFIEGTMTKVPFRGHVKYILRKIKQGLQSAFSYSNATTLQEYQRNVRWEKV